MTDAAKRTMSESQRAALEKFLVYAAEGKAPSTQMVEAAKAEIERLNVALDTIAHAALEPGWRLREAAMETLYNREWTW